MANIQRPKNLETGEIRRGKDTWWPVYRGENEMTCEHKRMLNFIYDKKN